MRESQARRLYWRASKLEQRGDFSAARATFERVLQSGDSYGPIAGLALGRMLLIRGDLDGARAAFERTLGYSGTPLGPEPEEGNWTYKAAFGLEAVLEHQGDRSGARVARERARELMRAYARAKGAEGLHPAAFELERGTALESFRQFVMAEQAFRRSLTQGHAHFSAQAAYSLARMLTEQQDYEGALAALEKVIEFEHPSLTAPARAQAEELRVRTGGG
jgi:tetratricopeptide (TPR) repeat protein